MSQIQPAVPDRRLAPRPLPAHLLSAIVLWLSSRAALMSWRGGSPLSNAPAENPLQALAKEFEKLGVDRVAAALDRELLRRAQDFAAGLQAYRRHPFRRAAPRTPVAWQEANVRLLDYGSACKAPAVLVVPSLINRYYVLDLLPEQSFLRHLAASGLRPFVVDWGEPGAAERDFTLSDYIAGPLDRVLTKARDLTRGPVTIIGYWPCAAPPTPPRSPCSLRPGIFMPSARSRRGCSANWARCCRDFSPRESRSRFR